MPHERTIGIDPLRSTLGQADLAAIVSLHGVVYSGEFGFDTTFEAYVAGPLGEFARRARPREHLWVAHRDGRLVGCIAIVEASRETAQLRWFLVDPIARGAGLGSRLLREAITFCQTCGYGEVFLWTVHALTAAARLYRSVGFRKTEERPCRAWGVEVVEERYDLKLPAAFRLQAEHGESSLG